MTKKRKLNEFSATKAVKELARERVGQPKPSRVLDSKPREGRQVKHKQRFEELAEEEHSDASRKK